MAKRDFYEVLGVSRDASDKDIKSAYRKLAMQHHPDRNAGDASAEVKFKEAGEAYDALKDSQKRAQYDRFGHAAFEGGGGGGGHPGGGGFEGFADVFEDLFGGFGGFGGNGGGARRQAASRGSDLQYDMDVSLEEAFAGKKAKVRIPTSDACGTCDGSGAEAGSKPVNCTTCNGRGKVRMQQGIFAVERACHSCQGNGQIIANPCKKCSGTGRTQAEKSLSVDIPASVEDGMRIRLRGKGEAGFRGGESGDLYIVLSVRPHKIFRREGPNLHLDVPVALATAALGGSIEVPTIEGGKIEVKIPAGTQSGATFRLRSKGMGVYGRSGRGDSLISVKVETPTNLTSRQKELLEEFVAEGGGSNPQSQNWFKKVKEFWAGA